MRNEETGTAQERRTLAAITRRLERMPHWRLSEAMFECAWRVKAAGGEGILRAFVTLFESAQEGTAGPGAVVLVRAESRPVGEESSTDFVSTVRHRLGARYAESRTSAGAVEFVRVLRGASDKAVRHELASVERTAGANATTNPSAAPRGGGLVSRLLPPKSPWRAHSLRVESGKLEGGLVVAYLHVTVRDRLFRPLMFATVFAQRARAKAKARAAAFRRLEAFEYRRIQASRGDWVLQRVLEGFEVEEFVTEARRLGAWMDEVRAAGRT